jgi:peptidyl-prolyl cis-trans isomerase A (cyclophilin A)
MRMWKSMVTVLTAVAMPCVFAGGVAAQTKPGTKSAAQGKPATATPAPAFDKALLNPAALSAKAPDTFEVKFTTTKGDFTVKVTRAWAPLGADRFYNLARHHFYDGAAFFRVLPGFVVQFGISAYPPVARAWSNAAIKDDPVKQSNKRGLLTYAMGGPNTRTTQVFINLVDNARLDSSGFSPFGEVTEGMDVVEKFYSGYGEGAPSGRGPRQDLIESQGRAYLEKNFPNLDSIKSAVIISPPPAGPPAKTTAKSPAKKSS